MGANAMALPSGDIVVTDGLMALVNDDRELMGVLLHERGHVVRRHGVRLLLQNSIVQLFLAWYVGDVNTLAVTAPAMFARAKYSRDLEQQADDDAAAVMQLNGMSTGYLADLLERLQASKGAGNGPAISYLSSHPATSDRIARLRTGK
jgi:Zn-dependent protease with chaperone function